MAYTKYANQRWLTVLNSNNITAADYEALARLNKNARKLYEAICYKSYEWDTMRFAFSSAAMYYEIGVDPSDVCKAWKELEDAGIIFKDDNTSNEYFIKANVGNNCCRNPQSNNIKSEPEVSEGERKVRSKKMITIKSHNKHVCIMANLSGSAQLLATELMKGELCYNAEALAAQFKVNRSSIQRAYDELKAAKYIVDYKGEVHFCSVPYFSCGQHYAELCGFEDDYAAHFAFCDTAA